VYKAGTLTISATKPNPLRRVFHFMPMKTCIRCRFFTDGSISKHATYIDPVCTVHGGDAAMFMREYVCTLEGRLWQAKTEQAHPPVDTATDGRRHALPT